MKALLIFILLMIATPCYSADYTVCASGCSATSLITLINTGTITVNDKIFIKSNLGYVRLVDLLYPINGVYFLTSDASILFPPGKLSLIFNKEGSFKGSFTWRIYSADVIPSGIVIPINTLVGGV
jgi:hypothetical protein